MKSSSSSVSLCDFVCNYIIYYYANAKKVNARSHGDTCDIYTLTANTNAKSEKKTPTKNKSKTN